MDGRSPFRPCSGRGRYRYRDSDHACAPRATYIARSITMPRFRLGRIEKISEIFDKTQASTRPHGQRLQAMAPVTPLTGQESEKHIYGVVRAEPCCQVQSTDIVSSCRKAIAVQPASYGHGCWSARLWTTAFTGGEAQGESRHVEDVRHRLVSDIARGPNACKNARRRRCAHRWARPC